MHRLLPWSRSLLIFAILLPVRFYQICLRPVLPAVCRFHPTCSEYFIQSVYKYGPVHGTWKGICRLCRCNPWYPGGYDPP